MSSTTIPRRSIAERTTTTILRQRHTATAVAGASAQSVAVGPPAGKKWLIHSAVAEAQFDGNPGGNDGGNAQGEVLDAGGAVYAISGATCDNKDSNQSVLYGMNAPDMTLEEGDEVRLNVGAAMSTVDINGIFTFWGFEYDA